MTTPAPDPTGAPTPYLGLLAPHLASDRLAVVEAHDTWTGHQLSCRAAAAAEWLDEIGADTGRPVAALVAASGAALALLLAGMATGRPMAPLGIRLTPAELRGCLSNLNARLLVVDPDLVDLAEQAASGLGLEVVERPAFSESDRARDDRDPARPRSPEHPLPAPPPLRSGPDPPGNVAKGAPRFPGAARPGRRTSPHLTGPAGPGGGPAHRSADAGGIGEIVVRAPHLFRPDPDGWLRTGDLGQLDAEGYLFLTGRLGDMIVREGENVYPDEVERAIATHPAVREVAVVGAPGPGPGPTRRGVHRAHGRRRRDSGRGPPPSLAPRARRFQGARRLANHRGAPAQRRRQGAPTITASRPSVSRIDDGGAPRTPRTSSAGTCSPTAGCHRSGPSAEPSRVRPASRSSTCRTSPRTTSRPCADGARRSNSTSTTSGSSASTIGSFACGAST